MIYANIHTYDNGTGPKECIQGSRTPVQGWASFNVQSVDELEIVAGVIQLKTQATKDAEANSALLPVAKQELADTDTVPLRCMEHGVAYPAEWLAYRSALRDIVSGRDTTSVTMPVRPAWPAGT